MLQIGCGINMCKCIILPAEKFPWLFLLACIHTHSICLTTYCTQKTFQGRSEKPNYLKTGLWFRFSAEMQFLKIGCFFKHLRRLFTLCTGTKAHPILSFRSSKKQHSFVLPSQRDIAIFTRRCFGQFFRAETSGDLYPILSQNSLFFIHIPVKDSCFHFCTLGYVHILRGDICKYTLLRLQRKMR